MSVHLINGELEPSNTGQNMKKSYSTSDFEVGTVTVKVYQCS